MEAFGLPAFNAKNWINSTLRDSGADKERSVLELIGKCQNHYKHIYTELNSTSLNVVNNLPRVVHEIDAIATEASQLQIKMHAVKQEITNVEKNTGSSIASIERIDKIKTALVKAKQALYEADNWTLLSNEIEAIFETGDIDVISAKLVSMQQSLNALANASDYELKKAQLEGLKNRLEALASPYVVEAMTKKLVEQSKKFVKIFDDMGRFPLLVKYYSKCQKVHLMQHWQSVVELDTEDNVVEALQNYYEMLSSNWQEQLKWCQEVMPRVQATDVLAELYIDLLTALSADFSQTVDVHIKRVDEPLPWLLLIKNCSKTFVNTFKSKNTGPFSFELTKAVYLYLSPIISKYGAYQKSHFNKELSLLSKSEDVMENVQALGPMNGKVISAAGEQLKLCQQLTEGCSMPSFIVAAECFFNSHLENYKSCLACVKEGKTKQSHVNVFQMCIILLENLGDLATSVKQFDTECIETVLALNFEKSEENERYPQLLLNSEKQSELFSLVESLTSAHEPSVFKTCYIILDSICREVYQTSFTTIFTPIVELVESVPSVPAWKQKAITSELPDYSYSPQEYITQIGQYLMNLPQLLDPLLSVDNPNLSTALSIVSGGTSLPEDAGLVELYLSRVAEATCRAFSEQILLLSSMGTSACKQLATDINYLGNVLEDLGFSLAEKLANIQLLLKLSPAEYASQSAGLPPQLVAAIRQMRNIISE